MDNVQQMEEKLLQNMELGQQTYAVRNEIIIDNDLRTMTIPPNLSILGVESDDDVNRIYFKMPKMFGDVDLSQFDIRINYMNGTSGDIYAVEDKAVDTEHITFSWLVGRNAAKVKGDTRFIVCMKKTDSQGVVIQEFNTSVAQLPVLEGLETKEQIVQKNPDIIEQILKKFDSVIPEQQIQDTVQKYLQENPIKETDPTVASWAKAPNKPIYNAEEVGALAKEHNTDGSSHNDIRLLITELKNKLNTIADSDDVSLDQLSEIVAYIKNNKNLIEQVTTNKLSVTDVINNLTTNVESKALSTAIGVELKRLIDNIPTPDVSSQISEYDKSGAAHDDIRKDVTKVKEDLNWLVSSGINRNIMECKFINSKSV